MGLTRHRSQARRRGGGGGTRAVEAVAADGPAMGGARHLWHPFTQMQDWLAEEHICVVAAEGVTLIDSEGNRYLDGVSSLWCNVHGHRHPHIDAAVKAQLDRVAHTTMLGLVNPAAAELAGRLAAIAPGGLNRVFYSDNGSTAVEIALKIAFQYWRQRGGACRSKTDFVALEHAYHGDTLGAVSVGGIDLFQDAYQPLLFPTHRVSAGDAGALERLLSEREGAIAAVILEPLVQGAAGMLLQPAGYLRAARDLCDRHRVLLICDEVATGFGRTGTMFACEQEGVTPDLLCLAKGLTGGYLPLAATLATEEVFAGFLGSHAELRTFFHGHTYTGNPLACAAAIASLEVFEIEQTLDRLGPKIELLAELLAPLASLPQVAEIRQRGFMVGIELAASPSNGTPFPPELRAGHRVTLEARRRGAIIRPLGDVVVLMPPLAIGERDLRTLVEITGESILAMLESLPGSGPGLADAA